MMMMMMMWTGGGQDKLMKLEMGNSLKQQHAGYSQRSGKHKRLFSF
jgi:hypothetical protein